MNETALDHPPSLAGRELRLASVPAPGGANPYLSLFYGALAPHGVKLVGGALPTRGWLRQYGETVDVIHLHWLDSIGRCPPPRLERLLPVPARWRRAAARHLLWPVEVLGFWRFLRLCRRRGIRLLWTLHNLEPHEDASAVDQLVHALIARHSDLILCHSAWSQGECLRRYRPHCPVVHMPLGNYDGVFPPARPRGQVCRELGLDPERPVVACLGQLRPYKGLDLACDAVAMLGGRVQLLLAGGDHDRFDLAGLRQRVGRTPGAVLLARRLTDQEYADLAGASEAILLPYTKITGSAALLAALSLGRGVIASDLPYFREVLGSREEAGLLFRAGDASALADALARYLQVPAARRERAARELAVAHAWPRVVEPVAAALRPWKSRTAAVGDASAPSRENPGRGKAPGACW